MGKKSKQEVICSCYGITKQDMKDAIGLGIVKYKLYQDATKIGKKCSSCKKKNKERFKKYKRKLGV
jgi:bacterioferritin-associated ferredoxin